LATANVAAQPASTNAPLEPADAYAWDYTSPIHRDVRSICRQLVGSANNTTCRGKKIAFDGDRRFRDLWELRVTSDDAAYSTLVVAGEAGVAQARFTWRAIDPDDPGCPSIVRSQGLERAWIDNGHLVLISAGETTSYVDPSPHDPTDIGMRTQLVRGVVVLSWQDDGLRTRDYTMWMGPTYGHKMRPTSQSRLSWDAIPWQARRRPTIDEQGRLLIAAYR
ncbi:MAG: hypothetical protein RIF41_02980, partial [Polyangiaceae bacterium]